MVSYELSPEQVVDEIHGLFADYGSESYAEKCTQLMHAEQCGTLALEWGHDEEIALAAFLHDIGHFIAQRNHQAGFDEFGYFKHDGVGEAYLRKHGFGERIARMVGNHVAAKRYLSGTRDGYINKLSYASKETLRQQGGPMNAQEQREFEKNTDLADLITLRELDDAGKQEDLQVRELSFWLKLALKVLETNRSRNA